MPLKEDVGPSTRLMRTALPGQRVARSQACASLAPLPPERSRRWGKKDRRRGEWERKEVDEGEAGGG